MDIVCDVLRKYNVPAFKLASPGFNLNDGTQVGKQITIYYEVDPKNNWKSMLEEIEERLKKAGVEPAKSLATAEKRLGSSEFIGYRNDRVTDAKGNKEYVDAAVATSYNPAGKEDPFLHILAKEQKKEDKKESQSTALEEKPRRHIAEKLKKIEDPNSTSKNKLGG